MKARYPMQDKIIGMINNEIISHCDMGFIYTDIEKILWESGIKNGTVMAYQAPYKDFSLTASMQNGELFLKAATPLAKVEMHSSHSRRELHQLGEKLAQIIRDEHIILAPPPDKKFIAELSKFDVGMTLNLNNHTELVCTAKNENVLTFKRTFEGNINELTIDSFANSSTFSVNLENPEDVHYLYGKAYMYRTNTADIRVSMRSDFGQRFCANIESSLRDNVPKTVKVGPLAVVASKEQNANGTAFYWYDAGGQQISRDTVGAIFAWANATIPEFSIKEWWNIDANEGLKPQIQGYSYNDFLQSVKQAAASRDYGLVLQKAFSYARNSNNVFTLTVSDLVVEDNENFVPVSYAFKSTGTQNQIYKITYEDGNFKSMPKSVTEISEKEFLAYCEKKHFESVMYLQNHAKQRFIELTERQNYSNRQAHDKILSELSADKNRNFLGITAEDINSV